MKLFIDYETPDIPYGGGLQFLKALKKEIKRGIGIELARTINSRVDMILVNGWSRGPRDHIDFRKIKNLKRHGFSNIWDLFFESFFEINTDKLTSRLFSKFNFPDLFYPIKNLFSDKVGVKIIHRVDGFRTLYSINSNFKILEKSDLVQLKLLYNSDFLIFQSLYSYHCAKLLGYKGTNYEIINNGVNQEIFHPSKTALDPSAEKLKLLAVSWSPNLNKGFKLISEFSELENVEVTFVGAWPKNLGSKNVKIIASLSNSELAEFYRKNHAIILASKYEACSNVALEGLSSGLPVLFIKSGSNTELCSNYGIQIDEDNLGLSVSKILKKYSYLRRKILNDRSKFGIQEVGKKYVDLFKKVNNN